MDNMEPRPRTSLALTGVIMLAAYCGMEYGDGICLSPNRQAWTTDCDNRILIVSARYQEAHRSG